VLEDEAADELRLCFMDDVAEDATAEETVVETF
jgi:hypothetical protein